MKEIKNNKPKSLVKKIFIKICRIFGYEIIDQNTFEVPTSNKFLNENLSILGKRSINIPLGEIKIKRKITALDIIIRTCTKINMLTQNKKRIFEKDKIEYTLRSINSILRSVKTSNQLKGIDVNFKIIDHESDNTSLNMINNLFKKNNINYSLINLEVSKFKKNINKKNQKEEEVTENQMSNMANIHQSLIESKKSKDLIYFVEDDYIHDKNSIDEMLLTYERISSQINNELILCPTDYPYLYTKSEL